MDNDIDPISPKITRRKMLGVLGTAGAALLAACGVPPAAPLPSVAPSAAPLPTAASPTTAAVAAATSVPREELCNLLSASSHAPSLFRVDDLGYYLKFWKNQMRRLDELQAKITNLEDLVVLSPDLGDPWRRTLFMHLTRTLQHFGQGQFRFFYEGFTGDPSLDANAGFGPRFARLKKANSNPPASYSPAEVLYEVVLRITQDIDLFEWAYYQRLCGSEDKRAFLAQADNLASKILWSATTLSGIDGWPFEPNSPSNVLEEEFEVKAILTFVYQREPVEGITPDVPVVYFPTIRILPYSQVALIGVPDPFAPNPENESKYSNLLAIPHELGHFRYWYSYAETGQPARNVRERRVTYDAPLKPLWQEEIFADTYALLLGGPLAALETQRLALKHDHRDFADFSGQYNIVYPPPLIRPLIQLKALKAMANRNPQKLLDVSSSQLDPSLDTIVQTMWENWISALEPRGYTDGTNFKDISIINQIQEKMSLDTDVNSGLPVDKQILIAIEALEEIFDFEQAKARTNWGWAYVMANLNPPLPPMSTPFPTISDLSTIGRGIQRMLEEGPIMHDTALDVPEPYPFEDATQSEIPPRWLDWVVHFKEYLDEAALDPNYAEILPGTLTGMDNTQNDADKNIWMRVFASSGWATQGPCVSPRHP